MIGLSCLLVQTLLRQKVKLQPSEISYRCPVYGHELYISVITAMLYFLLYILFLKIKESSATSLWFPISADE